MELLLVEDNLDDIAAVVRLAAKSALDVRVTTVMTADEAVARLSRRPTGLRARGARAPDVVLLDLNLPAKPGMELLRWMKDDDYLHEVPVVIVSGGDDDRAIEQGRELGAHSHIRKPITLQSLIWIVTAVRNYRSRLAMLPATSSEA